MFDQCSHPIRREAGQADEGGMSSQTARNLYSGIEEQHYFVPPTAALFKRIDADEYEVVVMQMLFVLAWGYEHSDKGA